MNWVTYCNNSEGQAFESPVSKDVSNWWSDCYGGCPRMFYHAFSGVAEWAPPGENHILYSEGVLKNVAYEAGKIQYTPTDDTGIEYLRLSFQPTRITVKGVKLSSHPDLKSEGYTVRNLGNGDYALKIRRTRAGEVVVQ